MDTLEQIKQLIVDTVNPVQIILFGSRARGDYREDSDYDLMVIVHSLYKNRMPASVDVLVSTTDRYDELANDTGVIYRHVKKEGRVIYDYAQ